MNGERVLRVDLHTHTHYSPDSILSPRRFVETCRRKGINCVAVTDHKTIRGALAVQELADFRVIVGEEIETSAGQVIGLFLREEVRPGLSPEETIETVRAMGGIVGVPHPYDRVRSSPLREEALLRILAQVDIIEVFNARTIFQADNERSRRLAEQHGKAMSAATDAHTPWEIGGAYTEMPAFEGPGDFLAALGKGKVVGRRSFVGFHLLSSWAKIKWRLHLGRRIAQ